MVYGQIPQGGFVEHKLIDPLSSSSGYVLNDTPGPWRITFDTNPDDCNMYCIMCEEHSEYSPLKKARLESKRPHRVMEISTIREVVKEMIPYGLKEIIPSTMGEPLLYDHFENILQICSENNVFMNLTTNGTWPKYGPEKWAQLICPVTRDVKISWNGSTPSIQESIMKGSSFERRVANLKSFIRARDRISGDGDNRCSVTLQVTFMESNVDELPDLIGLSAELGIDRVKGHHLWVHFPEISSLDMRRSHNSLKKWNQVVDLCEEAADKFRKADGTKVRLDNFVRLNLSSPGLMPDNWICPFLGKEAWVNWEGRFDPCCAPDAERKRLGYFGKINSDGGMTGIWQGIQYQRLVSNYMENEICRSCTLRRPAEEVKTS